MSKETDITVYVHVVTFNSAAYIKKCLTALVNQEGFSPGKNLIIEVTDNGSGDESADVVREEFEGCVELFKNSANFGFAAAHNQGVWRFLKSGAECLLILNPDVKLDSSSVINLVRALCGDKTAGITCPKLYRGDENLEPVQPLRLDSAGVYFDSSLRHFDRGSEEEEQGQYDESRYVFGASGAAMMLKRACVKDLLLDDDRDSQVLSGLYPFLSGSGVTRAKLFDEAFFAYREDAELCWRAGRLGWNTLYVPSAKGVHVRVVLPERRKELNPEINRWSVRNRFLMQIVNFSWLTDWRAILPGLIFRNLLVIGAVCTVERSSFAALIDVIKLAPRAFRRRRKLLARIKKFENSR